MKLHLLNASNQFGEYAEIISEVFDEIEETAKNLLGVNQVDVVVRHQPDFTIPELGIGGLTSEDGFAVYISIDVNRKIESNLIKAQLLHELHHAARFQQIKTKHSLASALINEGLACLFEEEQTGQKPIYASQKLDGDSVEKAKEQMNENEYNHHQWFFGSAEIPKWFGYSYGYQLCKEYSLKTGLSADKLVALSVEDII